MRASPTILRTAVMRRWSSEAGSLEGVWRGTWGVAVHTLHRVRNNQIRRLDRQVAVAEVVGSRSWRGVLGEKRGGGGGVGGAAAAGPANPRADISPSSDGDPGGRVPTGTPYQTS